MPLGDKTGPAGKGPMTGRGAGYCTGGNKPGNLNPPKSETEDDIESGERRPPIRLLPKRMKPKRAEPERIPESLDDTERLVVEAIGGLFNNSDDALGRTPHKETSHGFEFQWNSVEEMFALKSAKSTFHEELCGAFRDIHSYKYLDDPTFDVALVKRLTARGVPTEEIEKAKDYCKQIREQLQKEDFQEKDAGWHPNLDEVLDTTRNAHDRTPSTEAPFTGGGPAPAPNEIG